jgi:hypothetical protein
MAPKSNVQNTVITVLQKKDFVDTLAGAVDTVVNDSALMEHVNKIATHEKMQGVIEILNSHIPGAANKPALELKASADGKLPDGKLPDGKPPAQQPPVQQLPDGKLPDGKPPAQQPPVQQLPDGKPAVAKAAELKAAEANDDELHAELDRLVEEDLAAEKAAAVEGAGAVKGAAELKAELKAAVVKAKAIKGEWDKAPNNKKGELAAAHAAAVEEMNKVVAELKAANEAAAQAQAKGGRNRRTKKTNYYRKRRRSRRGRSRRGRSRRGRSRRRRSRRRRSRRN